MDAQSNDCEEVRRFLHEHVPEVGSGAIEIKGIARARGKRTIIAVYSTDERVDSVASCVGQRGIRAKTLVKHLSGEKVDVVLWSDSPKGFLGNLLGQYRIEEIFFDESARRATIFVSYDDKRSIMEAGDKLKLIARLTGWDLQLATG